MNADKDKATPRPWEVSRNCIFGAGRVVAVLFDEPDRRPYQEPDSSPPISSCSIANAALIAAAVNAYDAHRQLAEAARSLINPADPSDYRERLPSLRAALAALDALEKP